MKLTKKAFQVLDSLDNQEILSQRQLANQSGVSLSQANYLLKRFVKAGLVKIENYRKNPRKIGYSYHLTPKGIKAKSRVAASFVVAKLKEYNSLQERVAKKLEIIEKKGHFHIIFVGPKIAKDFVVSIIKENSLKLVLVGYFNRWEELKKYDSESFDIVLLLDDSPEDIKTITEATRILQEKLLLLI